MKDDYQRISEGNSDISAVLGQTKHPIIQYGKQEKFSKGKNIENIMVEDKKQELQEPLADIENGE